MNARLRTRLVVLLALPLLAAGCAAPVAETTSPAQSPAADEVVDVDADVADLTFDAGADLDPDWQIVWADSMLTDEAFEPLAPDDGAGTWSYTQVASQCVVAFQQTSAAGFDGADDAELSDAILLDYVGGDPAEVLPHAFEDAVPFLWDGELVTMDVSSLQGGDGADGSSFVTSARGLAALDLRLVVDVTCPAGVDAAETYEQLRDQASILATFQ